MHVRTSSHASQPHDSVHKYHARLCARRAPPTCILWLNVISLMWSPESSTALLSPVLATVTSHPLTITSVIVVPGLGSVRREKQAQVQRQASGQQGRLSQACCKANKASEGQRPNTGTQGD
jgi:hypothetical protein